jgi:hypothetical protein
MEFHVLRICGFLSVVIIAYAQGLLKVIQKKESASLQAMLVLSAGHCHYGGYGIQQHHPHQ